CECFSKTLSQCGDAALVLIERLPLRLACRAGAKCEHKWHEDRCSGARSAFETTGARQAGGVPICDSTPVELVESLPMGCHRSAEAVPRQEKSAFAPGAVPCHIPPP